ASSSARTCASPARSAGIGPDPGGSSRVNTARARGVPAARSGSGRGGPTTMSRPASGTAAATRAISGSPPTGAPGLSAPPSRAARPPARITASYGIAASAADRRHGAGRLQEAGIVDPVPGLLPPDRAPPQLGQLVVGRPGAHGGAQIGLLEREQAVAHLPVGGDPHPVAGAA